MSDQKVAIYVRCSTEVQSTNLQVDSLVKYCADNKLAYEIFEDYYTGKKLDRPNLQKMLSRIDEFSSVLIWRTDRLSRRVLDSMLLVKEIFEAGVVIISICDPFDLTTASGRFMFNIRLAQNQYEVDLISERTIAGLAATKRRGTKLGARERNFDMVKFNELKCSGLSVDDISSRMGFSKSGLYRKLRRNNVEF